MRWFKLTAAIMSLFLISLVPGCGDGNNLASVEGTVTLDGQAPANATVVIRQLPIQAIGSSNQRTGVHRLSYSDREFGAVPGKNIVRISTAQGVGLKEDGSSIPGVKESIPMKYNVQSTLSYDVQPKVKNVANWELDSQGPILKQSVWPRSQLRLGTGCIRGSASVLACFLKLDAQAEPARQCVPSGAAEPGNEAPRRLGTGWIRGSA